MCKRTLRRSLCLLFILILTAAFAITANAKTTAAPQEEPEAVPTLRIAYKNLSYASQTYVMYAVAYENVDAPESIRMLFWDTALQPGGYTRGTELYSASQMDPQTIGGIEHAVFRSRGIAPKKLGDVLYCRACVTVDGTDYYSEVLKYNPLQYIKTLMDRPHTTQAQIADYNIADALRSYGAAAQIRFAYNTDDLATDTHYYITLQNALLDDGFAYGLYKEGTVQTLTAQVAAGDSVARWVDSQGQTLGTGDTLEYTVVADTEIRAILASEPDSCEHEYSDWIAAADATCTEAGNVGHYHCSLCGRDFDVGYNVIEDVVLPALGHEWVEVAAQAPSCVIGWNAYRYCSRCELQENYEELPAVDPHDYVETVVEPVGELRGYTSHVCSVCGDSYKSDYNYSLYSGVDFSSEGKFALPYNFDSSTYTIEASIQLSPEVSSRAGVIMGNYDNASAGFNLEIYSNGRPRLHFKVGTGRNQVTYDNVFSTDIRSENVVSLAVTIEQGEARLYLDGVLAETKALADFEIPEIGRSMVLGGDNRAGNSQGFRGTIYSTTVFRDIRTEEELISDLIIANAADPNCIFSYNLVNGSELISGTTLDNVEEFAQVFTIEELSYHAGHGTRNIEVMNDITIDRTIYAIGDVTIYANSDCTLLRDPGFLGDVFVVGENAYGRNLILDNIFCELNLGKDGATGVLTIDGNKENVGEDDVVFGTLLYVNFSGTVNIHDGAVLTNNRKTGNSRTLGMEQYFANMIGGAAIVNINGTVNMDGGVISDNEINFSNPSEGDSTAENHLEACYGGAVFNNSNFVMTGGSFTGNTGYYGGAMANFLECSITGGVFDGNYTSHAGGAIYMQSSDTRVLTIGEPEGENDDPTAVIFRNNYTTESSGGAIYASANNYTLIYGGATFQNNHTPGSGGAVSIGGLGCIGPHTVFTGNTAGSNGGAVNLPTPSGDVRATTLEGVTFTNNTANHGGAVGMTGTNTTITDCVASDNHANGYGGAYYVNRMTGNIGATVVISGGELTGNTASEGGAIFGDLNCEITAEDLSVEDNSSVGNGGAISLHGVELLELDAVSFTGNSTGTNTPEEGTPVSGNGGALYASYRTVTDNSDPENPVTTRVESTVNVDSCLFSDNHSDGNAGAAMSIAYDNTTQVFTITNTTFEGNDASQHGGAIMVSSSVAELSNNVFDANTSGANGGAVYCNSRGWLLGSGNDFTENRANSTSYGGGALYFTNSGAELSGSTFTGNSSGANGGAVAAYTNSSVTLTDTVAQSNAAARQGGFAMTYNSSLTLDATGDFRNTLGDLADEAMGNTAGGGGAIYADYGSVISVSRADIGYNSTVGSGGAFYFTTATGTLDDCSFVHNTGGSAGGDSYGGAMMVGYGSNVTVENSAFSENTATTWAGAIYIRHANATETAAAIPSTVTAHDTSFCDNSSGIGGAIYAREYCSFSGTNCLFADNTATVESGGAIFASANSFLTLTDSVLMGNSTAVNGGAISAGGHAEVELIGVSLAQNTASGTGGAIYLATASKLTVSEGSLFDQNTSIGIGGAIYCNSADATLEDAAFTNNATTGSSAWYGGAIYTNGGSHLSAARCSFTENSNPHGTGGAICARGNGTLEITDSSFTGNTASSNGGALHLFELSSATITDTEFIDNASSGTGGAIMLGKSDVAANITLTVSGGLFNGNSASTGGAIHVTNGTKNDAVGVSTLSLSGTELTANTSTGGGGAIYANTDTVLSITDSTLEQNSTTGSGGAIYARENAAVTITDSAISNNEANYGGAMIVYGANVTLSGGTFSNNRGTGTGSYGGAIYLRKGGNNETGTIIANGTSFEGNVAPTGGAIYVNSGCTLTTTDVVFLENGGATGTNDGGAIYVASSGSIDLTGGSFENNAVKNSGGAIYLNGTAAAELEGVELTGNSGGLYGGAIYMNSSSHATIAGCTYTNNTNMNSYGGAICVRGSGAALTISGSSFGGNGAKLGGAISAFETVTVSITDTSFTGNSSASTGAAIMVGKSDVSANVVTLTLDGCGFVENKAATHGGAVYLLGTGTMTATNTDFTGNVAGSAGAGGSCGGAIYSYLDGSNENVTLSGCTFTNNRSTGNGGAIYHSAGSKMSWTGVTVEGNATSGGRGDAVYVTNGSGKQTTFNLVSAEFNQPARACIDIGNNNAYVTVHKPGVTDVNHSPVDFTLIITGTLTHVTYEET